MTSFVKCIQNVRGIYDEHKNRFRRRFVTTTLRFEKLLGKEHVDWWQKKKIVFLKSR